MGAVIEIFNVVSPVFLAIGLGFFLRTRKFIEEDAVSHLSRLVFYVAVPALLFRSAAVTELAEAFDLKTLAAAWAVSIFTAMGVFFLSRRLGPSRQGVMAQGAYRSNLVFVGLPVIANAYGNGVLGPAAVFIGLMVPIYNFLAVLVLILPHGDSAEGGKVAAKTAKQFLTNPLIIASVLGIAFSAFGPGLPLSLDRTLELVGRIAMPLALITVGASLDLSKLKADFIKTSIVSFIKLVAYPGIFFAILWSLGVRGVALAFPVLLLASPNAVLSHIMAKEMKGDERLAAAIVIATTLWSLLTISLWLAVFHFLFFNG